MADKERDFLNPRGNDERPSGRPNGRRPRISLGGFYLLVFLLQEVSADQTLPLPHGARIDPNASAVGGHSEGGAGSLTEFTGWSGGSSD
mgnify:CR=1 FL=1